MILSWISQRLTACHHSFMNFTEVNSLPPLFHEFHMAKMQSHFHEIHRRLTSWYHSFINFTRVALTLWSVSKLPGASYLSSQRPRTYYHSFVNFTKFRRLLLLFHEFHKSQEPVTTLASILKGQEAACCHCFISITKVKKLLSLSQYLLCDDKMCIALI